MHPTELERQCGCRYEYYLVKKIIVKMPDDRNYGYWLDTNCELEDFKKMGINMITEKEFNDLWNSVYYDRVAKEFKQTVIKNGD